MKKVVFLSLAAMLIGLSFTIGSSFAAEQEPAGETPVCIQGNWTTGYFTDRADYWYFDATIPSGTYRVILYEYIDGDDLYDRIVFDEVLTVSNSSTANHLLNQNYRYKLSGSGNSTANGCLKPCNSGGQACN